MASPEWPGTLLMSKLFAMNPLQRLSRRRRECDHRPETNPLTPGDDGGSTGQLDRLPSVGHMPRPALGWVGSARRIAVREFDFQADSAAVCAFQEDTYSLNFADFRYTSGFADAFRHDLRRAALDPHHGLFVLDAGHIVGFLWLVICENSWTRERYGYVNNLYIAAEFRGHGLARDLMAQGDSWFRSQGIRRVRLTVTASNTGACRLYERSGYAITRHEMEKDLF